MPELNGKSNHTGQARKGSRSIYGAHSSQVKLKGHAVRNTVLILLLLLVILLGICAGFGYKFYKEAMVVKGHEERAISLVSSINGDKAIQNPNAIAGIIPDLQQETDAARQIAHGNLWEVAAKIPVYGDDVRTVQGMVDVVDDVSHRSLPKLSDTATRLLAAKFSEGGGKVNLKPIEDASDGFAESNKMLKEELRTLKNLPDPKISKIDTLYRHGIKQFSAVSDKVDQTSDDIRIVPQFLGSKGTRNYVIAAQTPSEARSGGGLIGSLGSMTTDSGQIKVNSFHPNSDFINLARGGTYEEEAIFSGPLKFNFDIRDVSANPDFPHVATVVKQRWQLSRYSTPVDGVMMIDPVFIQEIIKISGEVRLPDGMALNGNNTAEFFMNGIYKTVPENMQDAVFAGVAAQAMNNVFKDLNMSKLIKIVKVIRPMAQSRHIYTFTFHEDEAANFQGAGLAKNAPDNPEKPEIGIYLNENNPSKLDWYIHRKTDITRTHCDKDGHQVYHVRFTMTNTIPQSDLNSGNRYILGGFAGIGQPGTPVERMLFYPPAGGSITDFHITGNATGLTTAKLDGKTLYTGIATLSPGRAVTYEYDVITSNRATSDLTLDQTPMGWSDPGITRNTGKCAIGR